MGGGATFDVSGLSSALTLGTSQTLIASGNGTQGTIKTASGKGLTMGTTSGLQFTAYNGGATAPLTVSGAGSLTLAAGNPVTVTVANGGNPLPVGTYTLIAAGVAGTVPTSVTVNGDGKPNYTTASLSIVSGALQLTIGCGTVPTPTAGNNGPVCTGSTLTLYTPTVANATYSWTGPNSFTSSAQNPTVSASATTAMAGTYYVTVTVNGCASAAGSTAVTVNSTPATPTAGNNGPVCTGSTLTLYTPTVANATYSWTGPNSFTSSAQNPTVSASATTAMAGTYYVTVTVNGCASAAGSTAVTVNSTPATPTAGNNGPVCTGSTLTLYTPTVANATYSWTGPNSFTSSAQNPTVSASATTAMAGTYYVTVTVNGCASAAGSTTVTVNSTPVITTDTTNQTACAGAQVTWSVAATGSGLGYQWQRSGTNLVEGSDNFTGTQTPTLINSAVAAQDAQDTNVLGQGYVCVITNSSACSVTSTLASLTVNPLPSTSAISGNSSVCANTAGVTYSVTATTGSSYGWTVPGDATITVGNTGPDNNQITVTFGSTTGDVTVTETNASGCVGTQQTLTVTVNAPPTVTITPSGSTTFCSGGSVGLTAGGASTYNWSPATGLSGTTDASVTASPTTTTTYTVTGTDANGCQNTAQVTVTVNSPPVITTDTTNQTVCTGSEVTWSVAATGTGLGYQWQRDGTNLVENSGNFTGTQTPTLTNSAVAAQDAQDTNVLGQGYVCLITNSCGPVLSTPASVTVNPLPTVSVNSATVCAGASATLTATTSASNPTYLWDDPSSATTASITVSPASTTTYTVTVTDGTTGCANSGSGTVTVNPLPTVSVNSVAVCPGGSATLTATISASNPTYLWDDPSSATTASITVSPASTTTYTVTVTDGTTGCANSGSGTVTVNPLPTVSVNSAAVCAGASATLTATTGASNPTYLWNDPSSATTASITVSPASTTTYTATVTDGTTGCANSGSGTVTVNSAPTADAGSAQTVCPGGSGVKIGGSPTAGGGTGPYTVSWAPATGLNDATLANPTANLAGTYTVTVTDANGCTANASVVVTVISQPEITSITLLGTDATLVWSHFRAKLTACNTRLTRWLILPARPGQI